MAANAITITNDQKKSLKRFLEQNRPAELINTYLFFIEQKFQMHPVLFPKEKTIFCNEEDAIKKIEEKGNLWRETEIKISYGQASVNEYTTKIYISHSGHVFGNNTHKNPQDAIYDLISKEKSERINGLKVKKFFVSEDPEVIKSYLNKQPTRETIKKTVYSSALSGKLFSTKEAVIQDFKEHYLEKLSLIEVQKQNKYLIEERLLEFFREQLQRDRIALFVEALAEFDEFTEDVERWVESED